MASCGSAGSGPHWLPAGHWTPRQPWKVWKEAAPSPPAGPRVHPQDRHPSRWQASLTQEPWESTQSWDPAKTLLPALHPWVAVPGVAAA